MNLGPVDGHSRCDTSWQVGHTTMAIMNMAPALAIPIVVRETRQLGKYKALRCTLRRKRMCAVERRYLITLAHFESEILLRHQCMFEKLVSKLAAKYFRGGARLVEVGHLEWVLKVIPDPGSCLTLCFLV